MKDQLIQTFDSEGAQAVLKELARTYLPHTEKVPLYEALSRYAYWQAKDLDAAILIGQAGIKLGEQLAEKFPGEAEVIMSQEKAIHYNLASFTWPGWDEKGIAISEEQRLLGLTWARINLDLAISLHKPSLPLSRAYWMLGAHHIAAGEYTAAKARFALGEQTAREAGSRPDELLCRGFSDLTALLADPHNPAAREKLAETQTALLKEKDGEFFAKQLEDAFRVFSTQ
ncbi:MAG: hypothetical protein JW757_12390 [Anaerolineales bacterium]|nr:hypothetical protein [Anaerolineales bacterium]